MLQRGQVRLRRVQRGPSLGGIRQAQCGTTVSQHVTDVGGAVARIDRDRNEAFGHRGQIADDPGHSIGQKDSDPVTGLKPGRSEGGPPPRHAVRDVTPCQRDPRTIFEVNIGRIIRGLAYPFREGRGNSAMRRALHGAGLLRVSHA